MVKFAVRNSVQKKKMIFGTEGDFSQQHIKEEKKNMDRAQARKKAEALVAKMTIEERAGQLKYDARRLNGWEFRLITGGMRHFTEWHVQVLQRYFHRQSVVRPCLMKRRCRRSLM